MSGTLPPDYNNQNCLQTLSRVPRGRGRVLIPCREPLVYIFENKNDTINQVATYMWRQLPISDSESYKGYHSWKKKKTTEGYVTGNWVMNQNWISSLEKRKGRLWVIKLIKTTFIFTIMSLSVDLFLFVLCRIQNSKHFQWRFTSFINSGKFSASISSSIASSPPLLSPGHTDYISQPRLPLGAGIWLGSGQRNKISYRQSSLLCLQAGSEIRKDPKGQQNHKTKRFCVLFFFLIYHLF